MSTPYKGPNSGPSNLYSTHLSKSQRYGLEVESWIFGKLVELGYSPTIPPDFSQSACDMRLNGLCVEVKAAKKTKRKRVLASGEVKYLDRWQWQIHPSHKTEYCLILVADAGRKRICFIVPGSIVGSRPHIQITSHPDKYNGWLSEYRERWSIIDYLLAEAYKDKGPLFSQWDLERVTDQERVAA